VVRTGYCRGRVRKANYTQVETMLIAAFIFVISLGAMIQFMALTWRSGLVQVAAQDVAVGIDMTINDFQDVATFQQLSPDLGSGSAPKLRSVSLYYRLLQIMGPVEPASWASREMALCTRYATVVLSQQLALNQALAAEMRSY
jgi:hypothetical protein